MAKSPTMKPGRVDEILSRHQPERTELIPILQDVQAALGHIPHDGMIQIARFLNLPASTVHGVVTFYAQFRLAPAGRHVIRVCEGTACHVHGGASLLRTVRRRLGIRPGQTTSDSRFTLERVACLGCCALAPVMVVDDVVYGNVTPERALAILEQMP